MSDDEFLSEATVAVARLYLDAVASSAVGEEMGIGNELAIELVLKRLVDIPDYIQLSPDGQGVDVTALVVPAVLLLSAATRTGWGVDELRTYVDHISPPTA